MRILASCALATALAGTLAAPVPQVQLGGASIGPPRVYPGAAGDTWFSTWARDGGIYVTSDDSPGFAGTCRGENITVSELSGSPARLTSRFVNCMTSYGAATSQQGGSYHDGRTWKTIGIISVAGVLYLAVARQDDGFGGYPAGFQPSADASIVKSADGGRTWTNPFGITGSPAGAVPPPRKRGTGAAAMFPGTSFAAPAFIQYGRDDDPGSTADGGDRYVYAISTDGFAYDGSAYILGRVPRSRIGALDAASWQFYTGQPGGNGTDPASWSAHPGRARPVLTAAHQLSQASVTWSPALRTYILASAYFPFAAAWPGGGTAHRTTWAFWQAPHPWGPWTRFWTGPSPLGFYDPAFVPKFATAGGLGQVVLAAADFGRPALYKLHVFPVRLARKQA